MTHALVTGASGFLGHYIVEQLVARGDSVRSFCRREDPRLTALGVEQFHADIRDRGEVMRACQDVNVVFHTAAVAGIWGLRSHYFDTNVEGTRNILEGCRAHHVERLVYTSSPSVTFDGSAQENVDESAPYPEHFLCHYPESKAAAEREVLTANGEPLGSCTLKTCSLRPHLIWGPRDPHLLPRLMARAKAGQLRRVGDGANLIDNIYVENAAAAHLQAADALMSADVPPAGRAYFITQGDPVNCWNWINEILVLADLPAVTRSISFAAAWRIGAVLETAHRLLAINKEPRMTRFLAAQLALPHYFDIRAARRDFGYEAKISTKEGMRRLAESDCVKGL